MQKDTLIKSAAVSLCFIAGILIGRYLVPTVRVSDTIPGSEIRIQGKFTNPLLECEVGGNSIASEKQDFTPELREFIDLLGETNHFENVAVYFRDLNNGPVIGINQNETYAPASLLKIPVMIAYLRWAEDDPRVLDEVIMYEKPVDLGYSQEFAPLVPLEIGETYSAKELIENMIRYSDNQALLLLFNRLPSTYQEELFRLVGIDTGLITNPTATLSVRRYSIFFRILFNASFLSRTHSEYALKLLTETTFTNGLRAGVPEKVDVAHKFGERKIENGLQQFHDCGIVYYPEHPYMLCIMTRGSNSDTLINAIQDISEFVYTQIDEQYGL